MLDKVSISGNKPVVNPDQLKLTHTIQVEILELKSSIGEMKNSMYRLNNRLNISEERVIELEDKSIEIIQPE